MASRRRRRFRPRPHEASSPLPGVAATPAAPGRGRLGLALLLLAGFWLGRLATFLPSGGLNALDLALALLSAVLLAIWYRRLARRYLQVRNAALRASVRRARDGTGERTD